MSYTSEYTVRHYKHGMATFGSVPVGDLLGIVATAQDRGLDVADAGIATALGASFAVTSETGGADWRAERRRRRRRRRSRAGREAPTWGSRP